MRSWIHHQAKTFNQFSTANPDWEKKKKKKTRPLNESNEERENDTERFVVDTFSLKVER